MSESLARKVTHKSRRLVHSALRPFGLERLEDRHRRSVATKGLRHLNDVLATTPLSTRYWMHGGVIIGWDRNGQLLPGDMDDFDFGYWLEDRAKFEDAMRALEAAGYEHVGTFRNTDGVVTIDRFQRGGVQYDFFAYWRDGSRMRTYSFQTVYEPESKTLRYVENLHEWTQQDTVPFEFLERTWYKYADHKLYLEENYAEGLNDPTWSYLQSPAIIERRPCSDPEN